MKIFILYLLCTVLLSGRLVYGGEASLLGNIAGSEEIQAEGAVEEEAVSEVAENNPEKITAGVQRRAKANPLRVMRDYENRLKASEKELEMLNIELEKTKILKAKKKAEMEIEEMRRNLAESGVPSNGISSMGVFAPESLNDESNGHLNIKVVYLAHSESLKEAVLTVDGVKYFVNEGDILSSEITVKEICADGVVIQYSGGGERKINFSRFEG